jgi:hypothetical protein
MLKRGNIASINLIQQLRLLYCLILCNNMKSSLTILRHKTINYMPLLDEVRDSDKVVLDHYYHM